MNLAHHGDAEVGPGLVDLAVNVRTDPMPAWLAEPIARSMGDLARYPDERPAIEALAARHRRPTTELLLTAGGAQAFVLVAQALRDARRPVVIHPQFTEAEAALIAAGHRVSRVILPEETGFRLDPALVPADADLVLIGNPTNPTSVTHPATAVAALARPGRVLVVDEAFADTVPGEPQSLASRRDLPGLLVLRSLTKTWGLAGLRIGYLLGEAELLRGLAAVRPLWAVSTPALAAAVACAGSAAAVAVDQIARRLAGERDHLVSLLSKVPGVRVAGEPASSFVLVRVDGADRIRLALRERGYAVRRGDTFPGLGPDWLRIAVRDTAISDGFADTFDEVVRAFRRGGRVTGRQHA